MAELLLEIKDNIATITLDNPPVNTLSIKILEEIDKIFHIIENNDDIHIVIVRAKGKFFSAGVNIHEFTKIESSEKASLTSSKGQDLFERIENFSKPVIAELNGGVYGGGLEFAMSCHIRLASFDTTFGLPEINLGIIPGFAGTQRLTRYVGVAKACELMLTGVPMNSEDALKFGLVNHLYDKSVLSERVIELATLIASKSPEAVRAILSLSYANKTVSFQRAVARESQLFGEIFNHADAKEGIAAFLEKRKPHFSIDRKV